MMASPGNVGTMIPSGPPYSPQIWMLGGLPDKKVDIPVTAVFLFLFACGAALHMTIFQINRKRGHKFLFNLFLFAFCMSRIATTGLRIASTSLPTNVNLAIAASVFVAAGVLILYIINLLFAQRILRSLHPSLGWHHTISIAFQALYGLVACTLVIVITATVQSFFTLRPRTRTIDRDLQLYAGTFLTVVSVLPILIVGAALAMPRKSPLEKFGQGRHRTKVIIVLTGTFLCCLGASFRCGTSWKRPVPLTHPRPAYFSKTCFYIFNFTLEIAVVYFYGFVRVDRRFWIPNGAKGQGSYVMDVRVGSVTDNEEVKEVEGGVEDGKPRDEGKQLNAGRELKEL